MWKQIRVGILLAVLGIVASNAWLDQRRVVTWRDSLYVGLFPVAADDRPATRAYLATLGREAFTSLEPFFAGEARRFQLPLDKPFRVELYPPLSAPPPQLEANAGPLATVWWSLRMRWYAWRSGSVAGHPAPHIRVFLLYHDPSLSPRLPHSSGMRKGQIGLVHAFAADAMSGGNEIVIAHEVLHTVGATDKYDAATDAPIYPQGFADPEQQPRYPQARAEIMAGRRALSPHEQEMPDTLDECTIGAATAAEIGWTPR